MWHGVQSPLIPTHTTIMAGKYLMAGKCQTYSHVQQATTTKSHFLSVLAVWVPYPISLKK